MNVSNLSCFNSYKFKLSICLRNLRQQLHELGFARGQIRAIEEMIASTAPAFNEPETNCASKARKPSNADKTYITDSLVEFSADSAIEAAARFIISEQDVFAPCEDGAATPRYIRIYEAQSGRRETFVFFKGLLGRRLVGGEVKSGAAPEDIVGGSTPELLQFQNTE